MPPSSGCPFVDPSLSSASCAYAQQMAQQMAPTSSGSLERGEETASLGLPATKNESPYHITTMAHHRQQQHFQQQHKQHHYQQQQQQHQPVMATQTNSSTYDLLQIQLLDQHHYQISANTNNANNNITANNDNNNNSDSPNPAPTSQAGSRASVYLENPENDYVNSDHPVNSDSYVNSDHQRLVNDDRQMPAKYADKETNNNDDDNDKDVRRDDNDDNDDSSIAPRFRQDFHRLHLSSLSSSIDGAMLQRELQRQQQQLQQPRQQLQHQTYRQQRVGSDSSLQMMPTYSSLENESTNTDLRTLTSMNSVTSMTDMTSDTAITSMNDMRPTNPALDQLTGSSLSYDHASSAGAIPFQEYLSSRGALPPPPPPPPFPPAHPLGPHPHATHSRGPQLSTSSSSSTSPSVINDEFKYF